jgi:hypothetical protein
MLPTPHKPNASPAVNMLDAMPQRSIPHGKAVDQAEMLIEWGRELR